MVRFRAPLRGVVALEILHFNDYLVHLSWILEEYLCCGFDIYASWLAHNCHSCLDDFLSISPELRDNRQYLRSLAWRALLKSGTSLDLKRRYRPIFAGRKPVDSKSCDASASGNDTLYSQV